MHHSQLYVTPATQLSRKVWPGIENFARPETSGSVPSLPNVRRFDNDKINRGMLVPGNIVQQQNFIQIDGMLTKHARKRMKNRGLSEAAVTAVVTYGRFVRTRGAGIYVIGRKEVEWHNGKQIHLAPYEGIQVVCSLEGIVITVYRNRDLRGLRPHRHHR